MVEVRMVLTLLAQSPRVEDFELGDHLGRRRASRIAAVKIGLPPSGLRRTSAVLRRQHRIAREATPNAWDVY